MRHQVHRTVERVPADRVVPPARHRYRRRPGTNDRVVRSPSRGASTTSCTRPARPTPPCGRPQTTSISVRTGASRSGGCRTTANVDGSVTSGSGTTTGGGDVAASDGSTVMTHDPMPQAHISRKNAAWRMNVTTCPIPRAMRRPRLGRAGGSGATAHGDRPAGAPPPEPRAAPAGRASARLRVGTCRAGSGVGGVGRPGRANGTGTGSRSKRLRTESNGIRSTAYRSSSAERITAAGDITREPDGHGGGVIPAHGDRGVRARKPPARPPRTRAPPPRNPPGGRCTHTSVRRSGYANSARHPRSCSITRPHSATVPTALTAGIDGVEVTRFRRLELA